MKTVFTIIGLLIATVSFGQTNNFNGKINSDEVKISDLNISVTVDSAEEVESTFNMKDIKELLDETEADEAITFEIICNGNIMSNGKKSTLSYKVTGTKEEARNFLKSVKKIRKAAIKYYKNKE
jgi:hypothetical protein